MTLFALTANSTSSLGGFMSSPISMILIMVLLFGFMYFFTIRPQKKRQEEEQKLRDAVQIGDDITTIGGITGKVVTVKEDSIVLETGTDRTRIKFMRWAIQTNNTANERAAEEKAALEAAKAKEKEDQQGKRRSRKKDVDETK